MTTQVTRPFPGCHFASRPPIVLSPADLDRMAIGVHMDDDPDFGIPSFAAYAPDPDRDYDRGRDAGYQEGYLAAQNEARMVRWAAPRLTRLDVFVIALGLIVASAALLAGAWA